MGSFCSKRMPMKEVKLYCQQIDEQPRKKKGDTEIYREPDHVKQSLFTGDTKIVTLQDIMIEAFEKHNDRDFLGIREKDDKGKWNPEYSFKTFQTVQDTAQNLGSGMSFLNLAGKASHKYEFKIKFIGIYAGSVADCIYLDLACAGYGKFKIKTKN
jgi:hypothetical protein